MSLFGFMKNTEEKKRPVDKALIAKIKSVKVLGAGCKNCHRQLENVKKALEVLTEMGEDAYIIGEIIKGDEGVVLA